MGEIYLGIIARKMRLGDGVVRGRGLVAGVQKKWMLLVATAVVMCTRCCLGYGRRQQQ
jgi:hypothetical protein